MNAKFLAGAALGLAAILASAVGGQAMGAPPSSLTVTQADEGKTFELAAGQCLNVRLGTQPSTGYGWEVAPDSTPLLTFKDASILNPATMPGAVEIKELVFCAAAAGHGALKLVYRRSWEKDQPPAKSFSLSVTIKQ